MSQKINSKERLIDAAYGVTRQFVDDVAEKLATICTLTHEGEHPVGFVAQRVRETFSPLELEIIATMFIARVINEQNEEEAADEECDCPVCTAKRAGVPTNEDEAVTFITNALKKQFPGMQAEIIRIPRDKGGKTNC